MAFNTKIGLEDYTAVANQTTFTFSFKIYDDTDIVMVYNGVELIMGRDYDVTSINGDLGGVVTMDPTFTVANGDRLIMQRQLSVDRLVDYQTSGDLLADTLNFDQDYQTYLIADLYAELSHYNKAPVGTNVNYAFPTPIPSGIITWNTTGTALTSYVVPGGKIGNLLSDGSISMDNGYVPNAPQKIATLQSILDNAYDDNAITGRVTQVEADIVNKQDKNEKGSIDGYAGLDTTGKVPANQLPSYVDDVLEFQDMTAFPAVGEASKIYIAIDTNQTYRWTGTSYGGLGASSGGTILGETSTTAYRGDRGKIAFDHSSVNSGNPHGVTKADVGLGSVDNTTDVNKPMSTATATAIALKLDKSQVDNSLTSTSTINALSANQGKVLKALISDIVSGTTSLLNTTLTGNPVAPTPAVNDNDTSVATTAFVGTALGSFININQKAAVNGVATLGADQKIPDAQIPSISINNIYAVADEAEMLGLNAGAAQPNGGIHTGDMSVWATGEVHVARVTGATLITDWLEINSPAVTPVKSDWAVTTVSDLAYIDNKPTVVDDVSTGGTTDLLSAQQGVVLKQEIDNIISGTTPTVLSATATIPTSVVGSSNTNVANTEFVAEAIIADKATQTEVNTGTIDTKSVTPLTLKNSTQWDTKVGSVTSGNEKRIAEMVEMTQADYDALGAGRPKKLYIIVG